MNYFCVVTFSLTSTVKLPVQLGTSDVKVCSVGTEKMGKSGLLSR